MPGKPIVVAQMPEWCFKRMFRASDLAKLGEYADIAGPVDRTAGELSAVLKEAKVVFTGWGTPRIDDEFLQMSPTLGLIAHTAGSVKALISDAVFTRGIRVTTSAGANAVPVAHFTMAMMVSLLKQVPWISQAFAKGDQEEVERRKAVCRELQDIDVAIIGASRVGRVVIELLKAYPDVRIKLFDPYIGEEQARLLGVSKVSLEEACACDVVSIHAPSIPETRHMINARTLALMPNHVVLINTARGSLISEKDLIAEVRKRPMYVALDVTDPEPPAPDSPLRTEPNILLTPHIAGAMKQACRDMGALAIEEVLRFLEGKPLTAEVTPTMMPTQA